MSATATRAEPANPSDPEWQADCETRRLASRGFPTGRSGLQGSGDLQGCSPMPGPPAVNRDEHLGCKHEQHDT
jgi:hypothetical protein